MSARLPDLPEPILKALLDLPLTDEERGGAHGFELLDLLYPLDRHLCPEWTRHRGALLAVWLEEHPGTRPRTWWRVDAPRQPAGRWPGCFWDGALEEPRLRLGGTGTPSHEVLNYVPAYYSGIPYPWVTAWDVAWCTGTARDIHGELINPQAADDLEPFLGVAIDPKSPPRYEAQATYLRRNGLLLPGEAKRLHSQDFEPEVVMPQLDDTPSLSWRIRPL